MRSRLTIASLLLTSSLGFSATTGIDSAWLDDFSFATTLNNSLGVPLPVGSVIQIGYIPGAIADPATYSTATWGSFIPLTGDGSNNSGTHPTAMGDGSAPAGFYTVGVSFDTTAHSDVPAASSRIAVRFYDGTTIANSTFYNTVSINHSDWESVVPTAQGPPPANATMDFHGPGSGGTFVWEDDSNPFKTSVLIPEPSSALLGLLGVVFLLRRRREA